MSISGRFSAEMMMMNIKINLLYLFSRTFVFALKIGNVLIQHGGVTIYKRNSQTL